MIFIYHSNNKVVSVESDEKQTITFDPQSAISKIVGTIAQQFRQEKLVWCHWDYRELLNRAVLNTLFYHDKMFLSYRPDEDNYFGSTIGYVDASLFVNVNKEVCFPTWQMSSCVGMIHASVLNAFKESVPYDTDFDYYLSSVAKLGMPLGLLCYSQPKLLTGTIDTKISKANQSQIFRFIKQHYKTRWIFILILNQLVYEHEINWISICYSLFFNKRTNKNCNIDFVKVVSSVSLREEKTLDVIIPTIGRKQYLYDVLQDLAKQTHLPEKVIIVEQNPQEGSFSELDYLQNKKWPFEVKHIFTHQAGACNARNIALVEVKSEWVFLADDDIRISNDFLQSSMEQILHFNVKAVSVSCFQKEERNNYKTIFQWNSFGSGCSIISSETLAKCKFNMKYEFGFGEDSDFGMQLRNKGFDVLYLPKPKILHLKAPIGGFRTKSLLSWHNDSIQPKPSPTVMLYKVQYNTIQQIWGYKTILFFKYYRLQKIKNPVKYYINFQKQWSRSVFWANKLKKQNEI